MNKLLKKITIVLSLSACLAACDTEIESIDIQKPFEGSPAYYENLRAYKSREHQIGFGWFGGWTATGAVTSKYLASVPDSVDFVAIWGNSWQRENMTPEKTADLRYVQDVKGTKILGTILLGWVGKMLEAQNIVWPEDKHEALRMYARELSKMVIEVGFQGLDIDYEPNVGGKDDVRDCPQGADFEVFVEELGKYLGPESGTGYMLVIDGEIWGATPKIGKYFDFAIAQAYYATSQSGLQGRYDQISSIFKPEQFIITEDFEKGWRTGGSNFNDPDHGTIPSLLGMAYWNPTQGRKGGCGSYHMEYEYNHTDQEYKYLRQAIQIMNPAAK